MEITTTRQTTKPSFGQGRGQAYIADKARLCWYGETLVNYRWQIH
jgi:hypothetical protein